MAAFWVPGIEAKGPVSYGMWLSGGGTKNRLSGGSSYRWERPCSFFFNKLFGVGLNMMAGWRSGRVLGEGKERRMSLEEDEWC